MNLNLRSWKEFEMGKLFDIKKGKRLTSADQEDGNNNYIGAIDSNNGVANHIGQKPIHSANTISLSYNGSVGEAFLPIRTNIGQQMMLMHCIRIMMILINI